MSANILVLEDDHDSLELITYLLRAFGFTVISADSGTAGYELALKQHFDLIISDIQMPGMDGLELVSRLKALPQTGNTPCIALTALAMVGDRDRILAAGFDGYISKPLAADKLLDHINIFLSRWRHRPA